MPDHEPTTKEPQYQRCVELRDRDGLTPLGLMSNQTWHDDPKRLIYVLSRYKFVAKMLAGKQRVLEVGCADAFGTRVVQQHVDHVTAIDFDALFVEDVKKRMHPDWAIDVRVHDMLGGPVMDAANDGTQKQFDAAYSLDVIEHIKPENEVAFVANIAASLHEDGVLILGSPSIHSQPHASPASKAGHINCKDQPQLRALMETAFRNVFMFSMNDEVLHTGFGPMSHYLLAMGCGKR